MLPKIKHIEIRPKYLLLLLIYSMIFNVNAGSLIRFPTQNNCKFAPQESIDKAIDSILQSNFSITTDTTIYHPDSSAFSSSIACSDTTITISINLFISDTKQAISEDLVFASGNLTMDRITTSFQYLLSSKQLTKLPLSRVQIIGTRKAEIYKSNELWGTIPFEAFVKPGKYNLEIKGRHFLKHQLTFDLLPGHDTIIETSLYKQTRDIRNSMFLGSAALAVVGLYFNAVQKDRYNEYKVLKSPQKAAYDSAYKDYKNAVTIRNSSWVSASIAMFLGLTLTLDIPF